ncbi:MAG: DUF1015 domain-containing protein [Spirochaetia bacterium]|jgi:uncharacterized protein (DUF1015 family)|nr:DUF1015 domain-containing protein [Spirochaetia bacterium]
MNQFEKFGVKIPEILLPDTEKTDFDKWSVIACDQFTSNRDYWEDVKKTTQGKPSALNLILPECYLKEINLDEKIKSINKTMEDYLSGGVLKKTEPGFVLVDRETPYTKSRQGLLIAVDLEKYDYSEKANSPIRPTEKTVVDRLPPRIRIREKASLDLPHILFLIDDTEESIVEYLYARKDKLEKLYDFKLMKNGGKIRGWLVNSADDFGRLEKAFEKLQQKNRTLFAVGDGNHSLAAAKEVWNKIKKQPGVSEDHPARYALVEIININSAGLNFEPIHRVVFKTDSAKMLDAFKAETGCEIRKCTRKEVKTPEEPGRIFFAAGNRYGEILLKYEDNLLAAEKLQSFLDKYLAETGDEIDYIHGESDALEIAEKEGNIGFILPVITKKTFFKRITAKGVYPRKTFSIGESIEKRYYLESRLLKK